VGKARKFYAIARGVRPGVYTAWSGFGGAEEQVRGFAGALYRGFASRQEAEQWLKNPLPSPAPARKASVRSTPAAAAASPGTVVIYADGGCLGNPGPGGYGAIIIAGEERRELSQGFRLTTNNRMELAACIAALKTLRTAAAVILYTDSRYVVNGICKGWARKWRANNWMRTKTEAALNRDLWEEILALVGLHRVEFVWLRGHAGQPENERCDEIAKAAAQGTDLTEDHGYVQGRTGTPPGLFR
jgi:ribonuclease HI